MAVDPPVVVRVLSGQVALDVVVLSPRVGAEGTGVGFLPTVDEHVVLQILVPVAALHHLTAYGTHSVKLNHRTQGVLNDS